MMWIRIAMAAVLVLSSVPAAVAADGDGVTGLWLTATGEDGRSHVEVYAVGETYSGRIVWLEKPTYPDDDPQGMGGQDRVDRNNPADKWHERPILGLEILSGLHYAGDGLWQGGTIYDPANGKTYKCKMRLEGDTLDVRGFIGFSLLGRTTEWTRVESSD